MFLVPNHVYNASLMFVLCGNELGVVLFVFLGFACMSRWEMCYSRLAQTRNPHLSDNSRKLTIVTIWVFAPTRSFSFEWRAISLRQESLAWARTRRTSQCHCL